MSKPKEQHDGGLLLSALIEQVIVKKTGDKEFLLHRLDDGIWWAAIGNEIPGTLLDDGEGRGEFAVSGETPEKAVGNLLQRVK